MAKFGVGVMEALVVARPTDLVTRLNYLGSAASRVDSFWVPITA